MTEKGQVTARTQSLFNTVLSSALKDSLAPEKEFWSSSKTLITLVENYYPDKNLPALLLKFLGEGKRRSAFKMYLYVSLVDYFFNWFVSGRIFGKHDLKG